jgi:quercetin dioxygenase-like cupin family protein
LTGEELGGGLKRKIMSYDDNLMMVKVAFEKGGVGTLHSHFHTQMSYVDSGAFEITIGDKNRSTEKGRCLLHSAKHCARCFVPRSGRTC